MAAVKTLQAKKVAPIIGKEVSDAISGYKGVVRGVRIQNSGCVNVLVQQKGLDLDGCPKKATWLDFNGLVDYKKLPECERPDILGAEVKDKITDYTGIVTSVVALDTSDFRIYIQGKTRTIDGVPSPEHICDLMDIERLDAKPVAKTNNTGAPALLGRTLDRATGRGSYRA